VVDAPLGDDNIERFCDLVVEMTRSTDTRFILYSRATLTRRDPA
jgi:chromosome segregation protein